MKVVSGRGALFSLERTKFKSKHILLSHRRVRNANDLSGHALASRFVIRLFMQNYFHQQ
jgi:hypothetical protein